MNCTTREKAASNGGEKVSFCVWGMHILEIGAEYELGLAESLVIHDPMIVDKEGLIRGRVARDQVVEREPCV